MRNTLLSALALALACACARSTPPAPRSGPTVASGTPSAVAATSAVARAPSASVSSASTPRPICGMAARLVARGWRTELTPTSAIESPALAPGATTIVVLPDTQYYASCASRHFEDQTRWAARAKTERNVKAVITLGDLTDHNRADEWQYIRRGLAPVENELPVVLVTGNHDHGEDGAANRRSSLLSRYFPEPPGLAKGLLTATRAPKDPENAYYRIPLGRVTLGVLALEWSPRFGTLAWANDVLARHPSDRVIVVTHAYLYNDGTRYDWATKGDAQEWNPLEYGTNKLDAKQRDGRAPNPEAATDGEQLWNGLVKKHPGVFLVLSGHVLGNGTGRLASRGERGNLVEQVLVNYQMLQDGGLGYLRLIELAPDGRTARMKSFSPTLGLFATGADQTGVLAIDPPLW